MKSYRTMCIALCVLVMPVAALFAQATGDYRSTGAGLTGAAWGTASTWQRYNGSAWVAAPSAPTGSEIITVQAADSVSVNVAVSIAGRLVNQGKLGNSANLTFASGGIYEHAQNNGSLPVSTWSTGSTCMITGYVTGSKPSNANQNFFNFEWNCVGQTSNTDVGFSGANVIGGNFIVDTSGVSSRVYLTSPAGFVSPITINGDVIVRGGQCSSNGSGTAATIIINTLGNLTVTGGNFGVSRGSAPDVTWNLNGNMTVSNAILQNSGGTHINKIVFAGSRAHTISLTNVTYGGGTSPFSMDVQSGSTLNTGTTVIGASNSGSFHLNPGATLATGNTLGVNGAIQCTGASNGGGDSLSTAANYTFNGTAHQVTGTMMPATVNNLVINNAAGVTLSQPTTINGVLRLQAGVFDNTNQFTLGPGGTISFEGGSLLITSVQPTTDGLPRAFFVNQNYPNPFNPSTTIRYGLPDAAFVSVKIFNLLGQEVSTLFEGRQNAGVYVAHFDAAKLSSGIYLSRVQAGNLVDIKRMVLMK